MSDEVEKKIEKLIPSHQVGQLLRYGIGLSVGLAQVLSTRTSKSRDATIKVWNPRYLRFDWLLRKYRLVTANRGEITIEPDDPEWVLYEPYGPYGWLHGAALRSLAQPWLIRYWSRTWWSREREVHGQPIRAGIIPTKRDPGDEKIFLKQLSTLAHEATIRLPQGEDGNKFDLKLIQAQSDGWRGFKEILDHCDDSIAILLLGQRMSTKGVGGLGSQDKAGESTLLRILRQDARVGDVLRERVLMPWAEDNYGRAELAPYLKWEIEPPADLDKKSKALLTVSQALAQFALAPEYARNVDVRALLEEYDLPLNAEGDLPELPKPQDDEPAEDPAQEDETTDEPAEQDHADE